MASAAHSLRLCLRASSRQAAAPASRRPASRALFPQRAFSTSPIIQRRPKKDSGSSEEGEERERDFDVQEGKYPDEGEFEGFISAMSGARRVGGLGDLTPEERAELLEGMRANASPEKMAEEMQKMASEFYRVSNSDMTDVRRLAAGPKSSSPWNKGEFDQDLRIREEGGDEFEENDMMGMGHQKFEEYREYREYARLAAWQMPLLSKLAKPFQPPSTQEPLRWRYTTYMGEMHPAEAKVVVEFSPSDMPLNDAQKLKFKKILGVRYNPGTDIAKMSCEQFEHQAQNKRYLGDLVDSLIAKAKDPTDMFEDIPLDTRHYHTKEKPRFPKEWRMTDERRKALDDTREKAYLLDQKKQEEGKLVDGNARVLSFLNQPVEPVPLRVPAAQPLRR